MVDHLFNSTIRFAPGVKKLYFGFGAPIFVNLGHRLFLDPPWWAYKTRGSRAGGRGGWCRWKISTNGQGNLGLAPADGSISRRMPVGKISCDAALKKWLGHR